MAKMVSFRNLLLEDEEDICFGIVDDAGTCICGCCGGEFEPGDYEIIEELPWIDIQGAIEGD